MKKFFGMILVAVMMVSILGVAPEKAYAAKGYVEKQVKGECTKRKIIHINIDKVSANDAVKKIYKYGKKGIKTKVAYSIFFDTNEHVVNTEFKTDATYNKYSKKVKKFVKKLKKAPANKYGISMSLQDGTCTANEVIYCEKLFDAILKDKITENVGTAYTNHEIEEDISIPVISIKYSDLFKSTSDVKKLSDSAKLHLFCGAFSCDTKRLHYTQKYSCSYSFELLWKKTIKGACNDFANMWCYFADYICDEVVSTGVTCSNHVYALIGVKDVKGDWDYFKGNTELFAPWGQTKLGTGYSFRDKKLGKKALKWTKANESKENKTGIYTTTDFDEIYGKKFMQIADKLYAEVEAERAAEAAKEAEYTATVVAPPTTSTWNGVGDNPYYTYE